MKHENHSLSNPETEKNFDDTLKIQYLKKTLDSLPGSLYLKDLNGIYLDCNGFMVKGSGLSIKDIVGKSDYELWPQNAVRLKAHDQKVIESGEALKVEEEVILPHGKKLYFTVVKMPLRDNDNKIIGVIGNSIDITELKETQKALEKALLTAEIANKAKQEFLENMRHDIRTPLTGIIGFANIIATEVNEPKVKSYVDHLVSSCNALLDLHNEILEVIQVNSGDVPILRKKFVLKDRLQEVLNLYQAAASQKNIDLTFAYDDKIPTYLIGDPRRIHRIVLELIANALNFTHQGFVKVSASLYEQEESKVVVKIIIEDSGIGMPADKQEDVYLQFKRLTPSYQGIYKGAGLGLTIVKQFIDDLQGEINVKSELGKGTKFTCLFKLTKALSNEEAVKENEVAKPVKLPNTAKAPLLTDASELAPRLADKIHILVVEDNELAAMVVKTLLVSLNCQVETASTGKIAVQKAYQQDYDLIFMDIGLPDIDGHEVTKSIRLQELTKDKHIPIVALTAHVDDESKQRCIESGMNAVLNKPLTKEKALDVFNTYVHIPQVKEPQSDYNKPLSGKIMNAEPAIERAGEETYKQLVKVFLDSIPEERATLATIYNQKNWPSLEFWMLRFKSSPLYCGADRLYEACEQFEAALAAQQTNHYDYLFKQLNEEINTVEQVIKQGNY